jgi:anoctamin-10
LQLYGVSLPVVLVCTAAAFWLMLESIWKESLLIEWTLDWTTEEAGYLWQWIALAIVSVPTVIYAALVWVANMLYRRLATKLTEWGNIFIFINYSTSIFVHSNFF